MSDEALQRTKKRMERIDRMPVDLRECVHEFGLTVVDAFLQSGVHKAKTIRHLVQAVLRGSVEVGNRESSPSLMQAGFNDKPE